ncbi:mitochondrial antiviral-signaling protein [Gastrophryne carolinensis]
MGRAEDEFFKGLRSPDIYERIKVQQLLFYLSGVLSAGNVEQLQAKLERHGNSYVVFDLLNDLRKRDNWVNHLLEALWRSEQVDLYNVLRDRYRRLEPQNDIYSPPGLPPASQYSNPPPYNSLPPPEESRERREPYMQPELRNIQAAPPAETSPPLLVANETDNGAPDDDITKMPIPESRSLPTPSFVENVKAPKSPAQVISAPSSLLPRKATEAALRFKEQPVNQEVVESPENNLPTPPANNLHVVHNAVTEPNQRELPGHQLVVGSAAKCQPASAENNHHDVHNPVAVPSQPELPGHQLHNVLQMFGGLPVQYGGI